MPDSDCARARSGLRPRRDRDLRDFVRSPEHETLSVSRGSRLGYAPPPPVEIQAGQIVRVRSRQYLVEEVVPPPNPADSTLVRLSCLDDDAQGTQVGVLWEKEVDAELVVQTSWHKVQERGFDDPKGLRQNKSTP